MKTEEIQAMLRKKKAQVLILLNSSTKKQDPFLQYVSAVSPEVGIVAVPSKKKPSLFVAGFEVQHFKKESLIKRVKPFGADHPYTMIKEECRAKVVACNYNSMSINELKRLRKITGCKTIDVSKELGLLRQTKSKKELAIIEKSCIIASKILSKTIKNFKKFKTENQVKEFLEKETKREGCTFSFPPIVASGKDAALPHYSGSKKLAKGFCVIDFGVIFKGYCSDITRTVYLGKPGKEEVQIYNLVLKAQKDAELVIKPGFSTAKAHGIADKILGKRLVHSLGHGLGIEIHELPVISPRVKTKFEENMVFTIEPGYYHRNNLGIRIEDDYVVTKKGVKRLTSGSRKLVSIN